MARHLLKNTGAPVLATFRKDEANVKKRLLDGLSGAEDRLKLMEVDVKSKHLSISVNVTFCKIICTVIACCSTYPHLDL